MLLTVVSVTSTPEAVPPHAGDTWSLRSSGELAAGGGDLAATGVADRAGDPGRTHPGHELFLHRQRAGVPFAAGSGVERDEVHVHQGPEPFPEQAPEQVGPPGLVVDLADQRVLDG